KRFEVHTQLPLNTLEAAKTKVAPRLWLLCGFWDTTQVEQQPIEALTFRQLHQHVAEVATIIDRRPAEQSGALREGMNLRFALRVFHQPLAMIVGKAPKPITF